MRVPNLIALLAISLASAACSFDDTETVVANRLTSNQVILLDATNVIEQRWRHYPLRGKTEYRLAVFNGRVAVRAMGQNSASGLIRRVSVDPRKCPVLEWTWYAAAIQKSADLTQKSGDDVAASIFLLFGDPGFLSAPTPVPTLRYVWTNPRHSLGDVIDNPYMPSVVRNIIIRTGPSDGQRLVTERRNIVDDYTRAFGVKPSSNISAIVLFTDNDQTKEPTEAYYSKIVSLCIKETGHSG